MHDAVSGVFDVDAAGGSVGAGQRAGQGATNAATDGYGRVLVSPGLQVEAGAWKVYGDVEFPVFQDVNGNQLVASQLFKLEISHKF